MVASLQIFACPDRSSTLPGTAAKNLLKHLLEQATIPADTDIKLLATQMGLVASADSGADTLAELCRAVIEELPAEAESVRKGKEKVVMRLVGQVMKDSKGTADAKKAREVLLSMLVGEASS